MRTLKTLRPGQKGTKELLARYGPSLLCVRYRYDEGQRALSAFRWAAAEVDE